MQLLQKLVIIYFIIGVVIAIIFTIVNLLMDERDPDDPGPALSCVILMVIIPFIWPYAVQKAYKKMGEPE